MKINKQTLNMMKNFSDINMSIEVKAGNTLRTVSVQKNILAEAQVETTFPQDFAIYDLNKLLGVMNLFPDTEMEIGDKTMKIGGKVDYMFADPTMIVSPPEKELTFPEAEIKFILTNAEFNQTIKAATLLGLPHICVEGKDGKINLVATDVHNTSSDEYRSELGETDMVFNMVFKIENLKLYAGDYDVELTSKGISKFSHTSSNLQYFIATESDSTFGG